MIKFENTEVTGWEAAIRGMRNPMNSWAKSDSVLYPATENGCKTCPKRYDICTRLQPTNNGCFEIGENDIKLMRNLAKAGTDHGKFARMLVVTVDITAPLYWVAEHDTYKVGTVRNSCSFMHKGVNEPFNINDFSVEDERIYYILNPIEKKKYELVYPYETKEYRIFETNNGRKYKVYRNGRVVSCSFSCIDNYGTGRTRTFPERECKPSKISSSYYELQLGGRSGERWLLHRLVATVWLGNPNKYETVNHINGNKGDNSVENLEWCSRSDNIKHGFENGLYDENKIHLAYNSWKNGHRIVPPEIKSTIKNYYNNGVCLEDLCKKYNLPKMTISNMIFWKPCENEDLFQQAYCWESIIETLNKLREKYLETKDETIFFTIRQLLPQGYNVRYTWQANYQVLWNIYKSRKNHRLPEWHIFCDWAETLPYFKEIYM